MDEDAGPVGRDRSRTGRAAVAGVVAVGLALGVTELLSGLFGGVPSLVDAVGQMFIPFVPPALEDWAIATFGTSDKFVLNLVTTVGTLAFGAWAGTAFWRSRRSGTGIWLAFTAVGLLAALLQPLVSAATTMVCLGLGSALGFLALDRLRAADQVLVRIRTAADHGAEVADEHAARAIALSRRRFVGAASGVAVAGLVAAATGRALLRGRTRIDYDAIVLPAPTTPVPDPTATNALDVPGITPIVVPNDEFYRIDTALSVPRIDPEQWTLRIHGLVEQEVELTYDDVLAMDLVEAYVTLSCVSNRVGGDLVGNAKWLGVPLAKVLDLAGPRPEAAQIVGRSVDRWTGGFPIEVARQQEHALLAVGMNDEVLPARHGFPARLVVPGLYGYVSATKWITEIELTTWDGFDGYWIPRGWAKRGPIKTQSRIDVPALMATVAPGRTPVAGVAWAPTKGIAKVEARVDGGPWQEATLSTPLADTAWVQWVAEFDLDEGTHLVECRATDGTGFTQSDEYVPPRPDGAEGYDVVRVRVEA